ncbi:alginate lyase family protein [Pandoraea anhela]|uniref:Alginate lyase n=1 Tax=Pandoraea anhela TaxID=2508295 RepID=A0A5E4W946_9BURK|nr:alginate lyase family protein [Pandoraea anhela]VVE21507.1 alginate lyase [Pandoraea anhela]
MRDTLNPLIDSGLNARRRRLVGTCAAWALTAPFGAVRAASPTERSSSADRPPFALTSDVDAQALPTRVPVEIAKAVVRYAGLTVSRDTHVMPVVHTEGTLPHQANRDQSVLAQGDWRETALQAMAWRLCAPGEGEPHLARATAYVTQWLGAYRPSFNPIDETELATWIIGFDLIQSQLSSQTIAAMRAFGGELADGYSQIPHKVGDPSTGLNNWHSHRVKLAVAGAFVSGDASRIATARERFFSHAQQNIHDDGSTYDFHQRDAMHYVVYTLEPMLTAATMAAAHGEDWYGASRLKGRLAHALAWLLPYATGEKVHEEFVHSSVPFDARRAAAGVPGYAGMWNPAASATVYTIAAQLDDRFRPVAEKRAAPALVRAIYSRSFARLT